jgi:hypothetical protein
MTEHHYSLPGVPGGRTYLLEINPHYIVRTTLDTLNVIDARWIDTSSGVFIDITAVHADEARRLRGSPGALICKDTHRYEVSPPTGPFNEHCLLNGLQGIQEDDLFPLRDSLFEGIPVKVPHDFTKLLKLEYGRQSMTRIKFEG